MNDVRERAQIDLEERQGNEREPARIDVRVDGLTVFTECPSAPDSYKRAIDALGRFLAWRARPKLR